MKTQPYTAFVTIKFDKRVPDERFYTHLRAVLGKFDVTCTEVAVIGSSQEHNGCVFVLVQVDFAGADFATVQHARETLINEAPLTVWGVRRKTLTEAAFIVALATVAYHIFHALTSVSIVVVK